MLDIPVGEISRKLGVSEPTSTHFEAAKNGALDDGDLSVVTESERLRVSDLGLRDDPRP